MDLTVACTGDLHVDAHHTTEDVGICLGQAIDRALGDRAGIRRYGHAVLPMDETLVTCAVDLGGRPFWVWNAPMPTPKIGTFDSELVADFWQAVCTQGRMNLHVLLHYGRNTHHISEAIFKGLARALRAALRARPAEPTESLRPRERSDRIRPTDATRRPRTIRMADDPTAPHDNRSIPARPGRQRRPRRAGVRAAGVRDLAEPGQDPRGLQPAARPPAARRWRFAIYLVGARLTRSSAGICWSG